MQKERHGSSSSTTIIQFARKFIRADGKIDLVAALTRLNTMCCGHSIGKKRGQVLPGWENISLRELTLEQLQQLLNGDKGKDVRLKTGLLSSVVVRGDYFVCPELNPLVKPWSLSSIILAPLYWWRR